MQKRRKKKTMLTKLAKARLLKHTHTAHTLTAATHTHTHTTTVIDIENMKRNLMKQAESRRILVNVSKT